MSKVRAPVRQSGASYVEALVAVVVLSVSIGPLFSALNAGFMAVPAVSAVSRDLSCVRSQMEKIMAEPYSALLDAAVAAGTIATDSSYSVAADAACPDRRVYIARYDPTNPANNGYVTTDSGLLFVKTELADGTTRLTSLVARP